MIRPNGSPAVFHILAVIQPGRSHDGCYRRHKRTNLKPGRPAPCRITPSVLGVIPRLSIIGIRIGAIIAFEPDSVPSMETSRVDIAHGNKIACFFDLSFAFPITRCTML